MPKMSKAEAKRRLQEAADKVIRVLSHSIALGYTTRDSDKLLKIYNDIGQMKKKLG
tara:strand:+ start:131 stop:298 length:168 start_codon:yes stop_codon:yes gene_type:complete